MRQRRRENRWLAGYLNGDKNNDLIQIYFTRF